jgi:hypothetical protein
MSITAINGTYFGQGPVAGGSTILAFGGSSNQELAYIGTASPVLDGTLTAAVVNFIDGTNALSFTPSAVLCARSGGNAATTTGINSVSAINNIAFTVNFSAAGSAGNLLGLVFMVFK